MVWFVFFPFGGRGKIFGGSDIGGGGGGGYLYCIFFIGDHTRMRTSEGMPPVSGLCRTSGGRIGGPQ